jgi:hypothetical protein
VEELVKLAAHTNVVVESWAFASPLRAISHVMSVRVYASASARADSGDALRFVHGRWSLGLGRKRTNLFDLSLNTAHQSVAECVQHVRQLARSLQSQSNEDSWTPAVEEMLTVDIGGESMPLVGIGSTEQAIARIEEHLRGTRFQGSFGARSPLPPGLL